jgi:hypothetical protein
MTVRVINKFRLLSDNLTKQSRRQILPAALPILYAAIEIRYAVRAIAILIIQNNFGGPA